MTNFLFCPLRKTWVSDLPEERVRQSLIQDMTERLGYPANSIALEKSLGQLPHLEAHPFSLPKRRADLIVFVKDLHPQYPFYPLLLIECKAVHLTPKVLRQLVGYNHFVNAYFIAAVNQSDTFLGCYHPEYKDFKFQKGLLSYEELLKSAFAVSAYRFF